MYIDLDTYVKSKIGDDRPLKKVFIEMKKRLVLGTRKKGMERTKIPSPKKPILETKESSDAIYDMVLYSSTCKYPKKEGQRKG
jgi:hypothetical protein